MTAHRVRAHVACCIVPGLTGGVTARLRRLSRGPDVGEGTDEVGDAVRAMATTA
jgi:hypothetical protein